MTFGLTAVLAQAVDNGIKITHNSYVNSGDFGTLGWRHTNEFL